MRELKILFDLKMAFAKDGNEIVAKDRSEITAFRYKEVSFKIIGFICICHFSTNKWQFQNTELVPFLISQFLLYFLSLLSYHTFSHYSLSPTYYIFSLLFLVTFSLHFLFLLYYYTLSSLNPLSTFYFLIVLSLTNFSLNFLSLLSYYILSLLPLSTFSL